MSVLYVVCPWHLISCFFLPLFPLVGTCTNPFVERKTTQSFSSCSVMVMRKVSLRGCDELYMHYWVLYRWIVGPNLDLELK